MSKQDESLALLPNGFADVLPPDAEGEAVSVYTLMNIFRNYGYRRIKPPLLEFEDSLLAPGPGAHLSSETFRIMDPVSHRMLGVRSDTTSQIARVVSSRLKGEDHPLRLAYANDVLRTKGSQLRTERQFTQVGCELVDNTGEIQADIEICVLPVLGLKALGIVDVTLDLTIPGCIDALIDGMDQQSREIVEKAVMRRDSEALLQRGDKKSRIIAEIMLASGRAEAALEALKAIKGMDDELKANIERISNLCSGIGLALAEMAVTDVSITIDLIEQSGFEYHKNYGFTLFSSSSRGELGRGGKYDIRFGDKEPVDTARGFTLYMDTISKFTRAPEAYECVFIKADVSWSEVKVLHEQGWITCRAVKKGQKPKGCSHIYKNGEVERL